MHFKKDGTLCLISGSQAEGSSIEESRMHHLKEMLSFGASYSMLQ